MKKWIIGGVSLLALFLLGCQFFIPQKMVVSRTVVANANLNAAFRFLSKDSNWKKWWPEAADEMKAGKGLRAGDHLFTKNQNRYNSFGITIEKNKRKENSLLNFLAVDDDSVKIVWSTTLHAAGNNPFSKFSLYIEAEKIGNNFESILSAMLKHISQVKNLYDFDIRRETVKIEFMVSTRRTLPHYPITDDIYDLIRSIEAHIAKQPAKIEHPPLVHIKSADSISYDLMVAIPIDRQLPDSGIFKTKKMLRNGNILLTEMMGGRYSAQRALKQIETYAIDHRFRNIALPFQSFLTDRTVETDTTKWNTLIGYPIL